MVSSEKRYQKALTCAEHRELRRTALLRRTHCSCQISRWSSARKRHRAWRHHKTDSCFLLALPVSVLSEISPGRWKPWLQAAELSGPLFKRQSTMAPVPESVLKKRKRDEQWAKDKLAAVKTASLKAKEKRKTIFKRAEDYVKEYRSKVSRATNNGKHHTYSLGTYRSPIVW